ncbi:TonB-dependent receptor [bacterium]|nr:TonB-dependent receptor [bacterium]
MEKRISAMLLLLSLTSLVWSGEIKETLRAPESGDVYSSESASKGKNSGTISGVVKDKATGECLPGANVFLKDMSRGAATNVQGEFTITQVPPGTHTLIAKYIGYKEGSLSVVVDPGAKVFRTFNLVYAGIKGETVEITAQAEGQMEAINQQLSARTIKNIVAADRIQEIPDVNAAESVARLPGISIIRSGGEGQKVAIRGMEPKYNVMMVNGVRMQSTDRDDRSVDLNMISPNLLSGIEVTKAVTADMDADAVGGTVNLKISQASEGFHVNFSAQGGYGSVANNYGNYKTTGLVSNRFFNNKLGVQVAGSIDEYDRSSDVLSASYTTNEEQTKIKGLTVIDLNSVGISDMATTRKRSGGGLILDYRMPNGNLLLSNFVSNLSSDYISMENSLGVQGSQFNSISRVGDDNSNTVYSNALQGDFDLFGAKMDFSLSNSVSRQDVPDNLYMRVIAEQDQKGFETPLNETATPSEFLNSVKVYHNIFRVKHLESLQRDVVESEQNAMIDFSIPYSFTNHLTGNIRFGGKYRYDKRENDETVRWVHPDRDKPSQVFTAMMKDSLWTDLGLVLDDTGNGIHAHLFEDADYDIGNFLSGRENVNKFYYTADIDKMRHYETLARKWGYYFLDPLSSNQYDYTYKGTLYAYYIMTELNLGRYVMLMPGIRYENWTTDYDAFGTTYIGPEWYDYYNEKVTSKRERERWFPQIHLRLKPVDWFDLRLASTRTIIYPDYRAFSPYYYHDKGAPALVLGNTELVPAIAQNYDIYASLYHNYIGLLTCGYFYKEIDDLITPFTFQTTDASKINYKVPLHQTKNTVIGTWINLKDRTFVRGFEVDWQTNFWYLPSMLSGLVFNINYSHMKSETKYPYQTMVKKGTGPFGKMVYVDTTRAGRMPQQADDILNTTVGYDFRGFSARLSFLFQGNVVGAIAPRIELDSFTDDYYRWDLIVNQKLPWKGFQLYCNASNLTNRPDRHYTSTLELLSYAGYYGRTVDLGVRYRF